MTRRRPSRSADGSHAVERLEKAHLGVEVLAAVRDVDGRDRQIAEVGGDDAVLEVEVWDGESHGRSGHRSRLTCRATPE